MKTYRTKTGTFSEEELVVVVWKNPQRATKNSRLLETMTSDLSPFPLVFPLEFLTAGAWKNAIIVRKKEDVFSQIPNTSATRPLLIPLPIATQALGWEDFYIPSEYTATSTATVTVTERPNEDR